jgi:uncharacterized protein YaeQ
VENGPRGNYTARVAVKSTVFKVELQVSDVGRGYYEAHALTLARHPSETDVRLFARIVAFALNAHEHLQFTRGLSSVEEPDLWEVDLTGEVQHWIELGQPTEKRIRQSCSKANRVTIYSCQPHRSAVEHWHASVRETVERFDHLTIAHLRLGDERAVEGLVERSMRLTCMIDGDQIQVVDTDTGAALDVELAVLYP